MLQLDNVSFMYARPKGRVLDTTDLRARALAGALVIDGVSADIPRGRIVGILGPNGSGKTTLLRLISGSRRPTSGRVLIEGTPVERMSRRDVARRLAVVPQETHLAFEYTVLELVLMGRHPHLGLFELEGPGDMAAAHAALAATGTGQLEARRFSTLSGGEKQRVIIAAALAQASDVLLLDEPTASLDLGYQLEISSLLSDLNRERGVTIVISTHDLNLAAAVCHDLVLLKNGRVIASGPCSEVLTGENVRELYGVEADIHIHEKTGHHVVVPIARVPPRPRR